MRARSARSPVVAVAFALALATGGLAYGSAADDDGGTSTRGAQAAAPAPDRAGAVPQTTNMRPDRGVKPSKTAPNGSTAALGPGADTSVNHAPAPVDRSDKGKKNAKVTKDRGAKNAKATRDLGR